MRPKDRPPRGAYERDHFHGRFICKICSAEVHDWRRHDDWHEELDELLSGPAAADEAPAAGPESMDQLARRADAEGGAVGDWLAEAGIWRGGLRQIGAMLAADWTALCGLLRRRRPAPVTDVPDPARAAQWASMGPLIARTTGRD